MEKFNWRAYYDKMETKGIFPVIPTGEVSPDDAQYIQVRLPNDILRYARPCYAFGNVSCPTPAFLQQYKNDILIFVTYVNNDPRLIVYFGYTFIDGATESDPDLTNFPDESWYRSANFINRFNDAANTWALQQRDENLNVTQQISIQDEKTFVKSNDINLGGETGNEPSVLGDTLANLLDNLISAIMALTVSTSAGPSTPPINLAQFQEIQDQLNTIKSQIVRLN